MFKITALTTSTTLCSMISRLLVQAHRWECLLEYVT